MNEQNSTTEIVAVAETMLRGEMHLIEGCRKICNLRHKMNNLNDSEFLHFQGIDSETDHFPLGEFRNKCALEFLRRADAEMEQYLARTHDDILNACCEVIRVLS